MICFYLLKKNDKINTAEVCFYSYCPMFHWNNRLMCYNVDVMLQCSLTNKWFDYLFVDINFA